MTKIFLAQIGLAEKLPKICVTRCDPITCDMNGVRLTIISFLLFSLPVFVFFAAYYCPLNYEEDAA